MGGDVRERSGGEVARHEKTCCCCCAEPLLEQGTECWAWA